MDIQVSVEHASGLERRIRVKAPASGVEDAIDKRLQDLARTLSIKGFRPGKVPHNVVRQRYGTEIRRQVLQEFLQRTCRDALKQQQFEAVGPARIEQEQTENSDELAFVATFEIYPEFQVQGLDRLTVERPVITVTEPDIDELIQRLRRQRRTRRKTEGGVEEESLPEVDSEFCRSLGIASGAVADLREAAEKDMIREAPIQVREEVRLQLLHQLSEATTVELPLLLCEQEISKLQQRAGEKSGNTPAGTLPQADRFRAAAERNVRMGLIIRHIFKEQHLRILREEVNEKIVAACRPGEDVEKKQLWYSEHPEMLDHIEYAVMDDKVVDWLLQRATLVEKPMSFVEFIDLRRQKWGGLTNTQDSRVP